jgi:hypothetical protein
MRAQTSVRGARAPGGVQIESKTMMRILLPGRARSAAFLHNCKLAALGKTTE